MYGDLCQMTYDNYIRTKPEKEAVEEGLTEDQVKLRKAFQTGCPMVGGFKYLPSELMKLPAMNVLPPVVKRAGDPPPSPVVKQVTSTCSCSCPLFAPGKSMWPCWSYCRFCLIVFISASLEVARLGDELLPAKGARLTRDCI